MHVTKPHRTSISCEEIHMSIVDTITGLSHYYLHQSGDFNVNLGMRKHSNGNFESQSCEKEDCI